jgi:hypothetical protein
MFEGLLARAIGDGLDGVALVDRNGNAVATAGSLSGEIAMPMVALVLSRLKAADLADRLFAGEVVTLPLDEGEVAVAIARRRLFVVATRDPRLPQFEEHVRALRDAVAAGLDDSNGIPWDGGAGGSGSGPAELPVVEIGITLPRRRGKA